MNIIKSTQTQKNPAVVYLLGLSRGNSRQGMERALERILEALEVNAPVGQFAWHKIRYSHAQAIKMRLEEKFAPSTCNQSLSALRGVVKAAYLAGMLDERPYRAVMEIGNVTGNSQENGRYVRDEELQALFDTCGIDAKSIRDRAILALLFTGAGLRVSELVGLKLADYTGDGLRVVGKGRKHATQPIADWVTHLIEDWLQVRGEEPGAIFTQVRRGGAVKIRPLTRAGINYMLKTRCEEAGVEELSAHDGRRKFATALLESNVDVSLVQKLMRHASPNTTTRYDRRGERQKRAALAALSPL